MSKMTLNNKTISFLFLEHIHSKSRNGNKSKIKLDVIWGLIDKPMNSSDSPEMYLLSNSKKVAAVADKYAITEKEKYLISINWTKNTIGSKRYNFFL